MARAGLTLDEVRALDLSGWSLKPAAILSSSVGLFFGYVLTGELWGRIVRGLGGPALPTTVSVRLFMVANMGRYIPGKVWQIAGLAVLARERGVPASTATAAAVLGQGIALLSATTVGLGAVWAYAGGTPWRWLVPVAVVGIPVVALIPPVFHAIARLWFRLARTERPEGLSPSTAVGWLVLGIGTWIVYASSFWLLVTGLGHGAALVETASAFAAAYVLGYVILIAPAGIGVRESVLTFLLAGPLGVGTAGAVAAIARLWTTLVEVIPAAIFWIIHMSSTRVNEPRD